MRPFFPFYGSKWTIARRYPAPQFPLVVEPFAGSAAYATYYDVKQAVLVDADPIVAGVWAYLLRATPAEILALPELPEAGDCVDNYSALAQEARWLIGFWLNRGSAQPKKTRTAYSARTDKGQLNWGLAAKQRIASQLPALTGWSITNASFVQTPPTGPATWFIDPPYGVKGKHYRVKFSDYATLGGWSRQRAGQVIVCEGPGATWLPFQPLGSFKSSRGRADEMVWLSP